MNRTLFALASALFVAAIAAGCSTTAAKYSPSFDNVNVLRTDAAGANKIASAAVSNKPLGNEVCRLSGPVKLPGDVTPEAYIDDALKNELQLAGVYDATAAKKVTVQVTRVSLSTAIGDGSWTIEGTASMGGDTPFPLSATHKFDASFAAFQACSEAAEAFLPTTQAFLNTLFKSPQFQAYLKQ